MTPASDERILFKHFYEEALIRRSHELIALAHARLAAAELSRLEEPDITGRLCDAMNAVLDEKDAPEWATLLTVVDDEPQSVAQKTGKRRPRTDVCVRCINPRPEQRFRFEAKRLNDNAAIARYLGNDGMLALISGYYGDLRHAGMIAYVQILTTAHWSNRIKETLGRSPAKYRIVEPVTFPQLGVNMPEPVFWSEHQYEGKRSGKRITHALLLCV